MALPTLGSFTTSLLSPHFKKSKAHHGKAHAAKNGYSWTRVRKDQTCRDLQPDPATSVYQERTEPREDPDPATLS